MDAKMKCKKCDEIRGIIERCEEIMNITLSIFPEDRHAFPILDDLAKKAYIIIKNAMQENKA